MTEHQLATSVLVIGSGGAGLRAAIELAERGVDVLVVGKRPKADAHTALAAGGINAALATMDPSDTWQQHAADTIKESYLLANPEIVRVVAEQAPRGIQDLERYGMPFAREADGRISQRFFGAHTFRRTSFAGDYTGLEIQRTLVNRATQLDIPIHDTCYITRILVQDNVVFGAYGFDLNTGTRYVFHADVVILAAGGHTRIWRRTSSRRDENTGDSFRLAVLAGGRIRDPELVQFHPSGLLEPENAAGTLVSEAARGEGGVLTNASGERFMARYDPQRMELSTRDRVALAAYTEIKEGRGTPNGGVWLDVSHLPREQIMQRLPRVYQTLLELQMKDITREAVEIAPTAHYSMGGVWVSPADHSTGVEGLYAIGEASSGLHGANRLGGNSLIELLVYGRIVGEAAAEYSASLDAQRRSHAALGEARSEVDDLLAADGPENVRALQRALRNTMTEHAGVVRDEAGLRKGLAELDELEDRIRDVGVHPDLAGFQDLAHAFDLSASALSARATLECALERRETRGCHNRSDHPDLDPAHQVNLVWAGPGRVVREEIPPVPDEIASLMREVDTAGKLVE
ncbi:succinate dehydrogenase / fumarate reductase flavoprotein subunit [Lentzea albidocapillata subsp. violacea]|uniref:Succinate dehydrogenase / fumarate reductase flavoprotein subunit n=1 Tax=Lentzea albidocapillata subsp. violacea TaxID=128104 RepID=A0A1G9QRJ4_9PSEU|nr:FAD-dependent oxidoreductase [Lentzea albidocapillata]SDM13471.1 succinate dehydrogenase / fumarate reductase flavoprotein subunit [Lentzea albidocapillata subsp. violacea]